MTNNDHSGTYIKFLNLGDNFFSLYSCSDNLYCLGSSFLATATFEYSYDIFFLDQDIRVMGWVGGL